MIDQLFLTLQDILDLYNTTNKPNQHTHINPGDIPIVDNHAHLNLHENPQKAVENFKKHKGIRIIETSTNQNELQASLELQKKAQDSITSNRLLKISHAIHPEYLHPNSLVFYAQRIEPELKLAISRTLETQNSKYIIDYAIKVFNKYQGQIHAIGEIGLDIYKLSLDQIKPTLKLQQELLEAYLYLTAQHKKPIVLHIRGNNNQDHSLYKLVFSMIKQFENSYNLPAVYFHSFVGTLEYAKPIISAGYYLGFNGIFTYSSAKYLIEVAQHTPLNQILPETDSPFLIPNKAKTKLFVNKNQNEPLGVFWVIKKLLDIKTLKQ